MAATNIGRVVQVIGPVLDVEFDPEHLPDIYNALSLKSSGNGANDVNLIAEVQQHIGRGMVRAVSMTSTDGVTRGMDVVDTGDSISVPVGPPVLGRIINVLGEPVDEQGPITAEEGEVERWPIHREPPAVPPARAQDRGLRDGHQGHRPLGSLCKGRQDWPVRRSRRRKDRHHHGAHQQHRHGARRAFRLLRCG